MRFTTQSRSCGQPQGMESTFASIPFSYPFFEPNNLHTGPRKSTFAPEFGNENEVSSPYFAV